MAESSTQDHEALAQQVKADLEKAERIVADLRKTNTRLLIASVTSSGASTFVAGLTASQGPMVGQGVAGWRLACIVAAAFGLVSTVSTGLIQQLKISDRKSEGMECVGKLRSLDLTLATGTPDLEKVVKKYREIAETYPEFTR